jgi:transposase
MSNVCWGDVGPGERVVTDNLRAHTAAGVQPRIARRGARLLYMPPYAWDQSPLEPCWWKVKTGLRKASARIREAVDLAITEVLATVAETDARG